MTGAERSCPVWALANQKGGVGKTTLTVSLGGVAAMRGQRTLLIDLDPQGSMTGYLGMETPMADFSSHALFTDGGQAAESLPRATTTAGLDIIAAHPALSTVERQAAGRRGLGRALADACRELSPAYDRILVDCPPMHGILLVNAVVAADRVVLPLQTEYLAVTGLKRILRTMAMIEQSIGMSVPHLIVPNMFDRRIRASSNALESVQAEHGESLWPELVPVDFSFRESSRRHVPVNIAYPRSRGALAIERLFDDLCDREQARILLQPDRSRAEAGTDRARG